MIFNHMYFRIKNSGAIIECLSLYVISLLFIKFLMSVQFFSRFFDMLLPATFLYLSVLMVIVSGRDHGDYGFTFKGWLGDLLYVLLFVLVFFPIVFFAYAVYRKIVLPGAFHLSLPHGITEFAFVQILVVGLSEEAFFRGYLQQRLSEGISGNALSIPWISLSWAVIVANVFFTLAHIIILGQVWRINVFLPGLAFGWLRERRKSLIAPMLFHGLSNVFMLVLESSF